MRWQWRGRRLNPPHVILLRLVTYPVIFLLTLALCATLMLAHDRDMAERIWRGL